MELSAVESIVKTQLEVRLRNKLGTRFPKLSITSEPSDDTPSFPNVYVQLTDTTEVGMSIPNQVIHANRYNFTIDISTNTNKADANIVADACKDIMKLLRFRTSGPTYIKMNNLHRYVIRANRIIANGDTF